MSWQELQNSGRIRPQPASKQEIDDLRAVVGRDLEDAAIEELSSDRRFATAYNAVLQLAQMAIRCEGYRIAARVGHHQTTLDAVKLAIGSSVEATLDYFDTCRRKRNQLDYDRAEVASDTEAEELLKEAQTFRDVVEKWIERQHSQFAA